MNIPTALTQREVSLLQSVAAGKAVYEAGALLGASTVALARTARRVVSVDPHSGYPVYAPRPTWDTYLRNVQYAGVGDRVDVVRDVFQRHPPQGCQFAFADLTGDYHITAEFLAYCQMANVPLIAIHDFERGGCSGCTEAVNEYVRRYGCRVTRADSLVVLEA